MKPYYDVPVLLLYFNLSCLNNNPLPLLSHIMYIIIFYSFYYYVRQYRGMMENHEEGDVYCMGRSFPAGSFQCVKDDGAKGKSCSR